jgi:bisphosphoglycerate-independent phosphoglycerate mutase (AlkP superfamily)
VNAWQLSKEYDLAFWYWLSDIPGHGQDMPAALNILQSLDQLLEGLLDTWDGTDLVLFTSDHGNLEDLSTRRHTSNPVPALLIGPLSQRQVFSAGLTDLTGITPAILKLLG